MSGGQEARDRLHELLGEVMPANLADEDDDSDVDLPDSGVLTGWVVVAEWLGSDGNRWLSKISGGADGKKLPGWSERGFAQEVAFHWDK